MGLRGRNGILCSRVFGVNDIGPMTEVGNQARIPYIFVSREFTSRRVVSVFLVSLRIDGHSAEGAYPPTHVSP